MLTLIYLVFMMPVVAGLLYLLGVTRVWRRSWVLAVFMLTFWPTGVYALVRYWNEKDDSPRAPLLAALGVTVVWIGFLVWGMNHHPQETDVAVVQGDESAADEDGSDLQGDLQRSITLANLASRGGHVEWPDAKAAIEVPAHFRFIDRSALETLQGNDAPSAETLGWLVHESVNLAAADAWHVEVEWIGDGYVTASGFARQSGDALLAKAKDVWKTASKNAGEEAPPVLGGYAETPTYDAPHDSVTWVERFEPTNHDAPVLDCYAAKLGRRGALVFSVNDATTSRQELCLRSVRLLAGRTSYANGETYADHGLLDRSAGYDLAGFVAGENLLQQR